MCIIDIYFDLEKPNPTTNCDSLHSPGIHYTGCEDRMSFPSIGSMN